MSVEIKGRSFVIDGEEGLFIMNFWPSRTKTDITVEGKDIGSIDMNGMDVKFIRLK